MCKFSFTVKMREDVAALRDVAGDRARASGFWPTSSVLSSFTEPASVFAKPTMDLSTVVLPTPLLAHETNDLSGRHRRFTPRKMREPS